MSPDWAKDLRNFHTEVVGDEFPTEPTLISDTHRTLRQSLIKEETSELFAAMEGGDLVGIADGIIDSIYVLLGAAANYGIDPNPLWDEVHRTNMLKVGGETRADGKILKPEGWTPPRIAELLAEQSARDTTIGNNYRKLYGKY